MQLESETDAAAETTALPTPQSLNEQLPASTEVSKHIARTRCALRDILHGADPRRVAIVGPCSLHDPAAALEYARALHKIARETSKQLLIVMRTYFEKPRTCVGWKGLLKDPYLDGSGDLGAGLHTVRRLLLDINEIGLPCAAELLDPLASAYFSDLLSWAVIGARTVESQTHRELASALPMPVGLKNDTRGGIERAVHGMLAAQEPHSFLGLGAAGAPSHVQSRGNRDLCLVLRGGDGGTNHGAEQVAAAAARLRSAGLPSRLLVDCAHGNSGKDHTRQPAVAREVLAQIRGGQHAVMGLLLESNLRAGSQKLEPGASLEYGVSVTDACVGWEETERLLYEAASAVESEARTLIVAGGPRRSREPASVSHTGSAADRRGGPRQERTATTVG
jgi:3-deoxy-7-phosphoheptulonate synthase